MIKLKEQRQTQKRKQSENGDGECEQSEERSQPQDVSGRLPSSHSVSLQPPSHRIRSQSGSSSSSSSNLATSFTLIFKWNINFFFISEIRFCRSSACTGTGKSTESTRWENSFILSFCLVPEKYFLMKYSSITYHDDFHFFSSLVCCFLFHWNLLISSSIFLLHHISLCFSPFFNSLATSERRRELNIPGPAGSLYAQRRHLAICNHGAGGRHRRPRRAQLERVLRHLHRNPKLIETRPLLSSYKPLLRRRQAQQASAIVALTPEFGSLRRRFRSARCFWDHSSGEGVSAGEKEEEVAELRRWCQFYCFGLRFVRSVLTSQVMNGHDSRFMCAFFFQNFLFFVFLVFVACLKFGFLFLFRNTESIFALAGVWHAVGARSGRSVIFREGKGCFCTLRSGSGRFVFRK